MPDRAIQGDSSTLPKLLGCYEAELQPVLKDIVAETPDLVIDIGAAEGYYAIGLAFDMSPDAQDLCRHAASLNGVSSRVSVAGTCTPELLNALLPRARAPFIVCDCEGQERELIDPHRVPTLRSATLIVECHDFIDPTITSLLVERLSPTHEVAGVAEGARNPNEVAFLRELDSLDRWLAVCEYRPSMMHWLIARPRS